MGSLGIKAREKFGRRVMKLEIKSIWLAEQEITLAIT